MRREKKTSLAVASCAGTYAKEAAQLQDDGPTATNVVHVAFGGTKPTSQADGESPRHVRDIASLSEAALKRRYRMEFNSWRSRRYEAKKNSIAWDPQFITFSGFLRVLGPKPSPSHTLDKIVPSRGYVATNCRWADKEQQAVNRDTTHFVTVNSTTHSIAHWARLRNMSESTIRGRLRRGWPPEDAINPAIDHSSGVASHGAPHRPRARDQDLHIWPKDCAAQWEQAFQRETRGRHGDRAVFLALESLQALLNYPDPPCCDDDDRELSVSQQRALDDWWRTQDRLRDSVHRAFCVLRARGHELSMSERTVPILRSML